MHAARSTGQARARVGDCGAGDCVDEQAVLQDLNGWFLVFFHHVGVVVDRKRGMVGLYVDVVWALGSFFLFRSFFSLSLNVGNDGSTKVNEWNECFLGVSLLRGSCCIDLMSWPLSGREMRGELSENV